MHLLRPDLEELGYVEDDREDGHCADEEPEGALREQLVGPGREVTGFRSKQSLVVSMIVVWSLNSG